MKKLLTTLISSIKKENKTMQVNYHILNNSIVLNFEGKTITISKGDHRFDPVLNAIKSENFASIPDIVDMEKELRDAGLQVEAGMVIINGEAMPEVLHSRIMEFKKNDLPFDRLLKFWDNLKENPSFNSRKMLYQFLEHNGHPLTSDGCFIAYRGVREDFKDCHSGKFNNSPGSVCEVPRSQVDDNPNNTCSFGLHVACHSFAKGFGQRLVEVKVNPSDVVAVPKDYEGTKMRVCRFEVVRECDGIKESPTYDYDRPDVYDEYEEGQCPECGEDIETFDSYCSCCGESLA